MSLTEDQIKKGFWFYDPENDWSPRTITYIEDYKQSEKISLAITQIETKTSIQNKIIDSWCELLPTLVNVKYLWLRSKVNQKIFDAVCKIKNLEGLYIKWSGIKSVNNIANLKELKHLHIGSSSQIVSIENLKYCNKLITLDLENLKNITNFSILSSLNTLEGLEVNGSMWSTQKIENLNFLENLTNLKYLTLYNTSIKSKTIAPIFNLNKLVRFDTYGNYSKDEFQKLKSIPTLKYGDIETLHKKSNKI